jgi:hypothetical protein
LKLPRIPLAIAKPTVSGMLGALSLALGPASPSMRNAIDRAERLDSADAVQPVDAVS